MITLNFKSAKSGFFDRTVVINAVDKATRRVLSRFGAFVWKSAKSSIRSHKRKAIGPEARDQRGRFLKRDKRSVSLPGQPPWSQTGLLKKFLFFSWDNTTRSVVIGPARLNSVVDPNSLHALEYGGESTVEEHRFVSGAKYGNRTRYIAERRKIRVKARPFMGPALAKELPGLPAMWRDSVR